jgi:hypothetical protein
MPVICPNCKREVPDTAKACGYCGHWLADEGETTVQVPEDMGATIALAETKERSPWLWIGAGLVVVALVVAAGVLAYLVGRGRGGIDTEAAPAATSQAESVRPPSEAVAVAPATPVESEPVELVMYDDFEGPAFEGAYDQARWRRDGVLPSDFSQEEGMLVVTLDSAPEENTFLVARDYDYAPLTAPTSFQATLRLDPAHDAGAVTLAVDAEISEDEWWWTDCSVDKDWVGCYADPDYDTQGIPADRDLGHTLRIDVDPATMQFTYSIDGRQMGSFVPPNAEDFKAARFYFKVGVWAESEAAVVGYIDEVRIGRVE